MPSIHRRIWNKFHIKYGDTLPMSSFVGTRKDLADLFNELGYKTGAEIGVEMGYFSKVLCESIPGLKLKCIDPWVGYSRSVNNEKAERYYQYTLDRLKPFPGVEIIRKTSMDAVKETPDASLDFVYIDELHDFDSVMMDLIRWTPKVRKGGIVSGHDYFQTYAYGVVQAVDAYTRAHGIRLYYAIVTERSFPSWFWLRE